MRLSFWALCALALLATVFSSSPLVTMAETASSITPQVAKIEAKLLSAVQADLQVEVDIMVQLESPEEVMQRVCNTSDGSTLTRAQKTTCMVDNMQKFADESQQQVKDLLEQHKNEYKDSTFFWINNSVCVKKAKGSLVLLLSGLETVLRIRPEQIFHTMQSGGKKEDAPAGGAKTFGFATAH